MVVRVSGTLVHGSGLFAGLLFAPLVPDLLTKPYLVRDFTRGMDGLPELRSTGYAFDVGRYPARYELLPPPGSTANALPRCACIAQVSREAARHVRDGSLHQRCGPVGRGRT